MNQMYPGGREHFALATANWVSHANYFCRIGLGYQFDPAHRVWADVSAAFPGGTILATTALTGKTSGSNGAAGASDTNVVASFASPGDPFDCIFVGWYANVLDPANYRMLAFYDTRMDGRPIADVMPSDVTVLLDWTGTNDGGLFRL